MTICYFTKALLLFKLNGPLELQHSQLEIYDRSLVLLLISLASLH